MTLLSTQKKCPQTPILFVLICIAAFSGLIYTPGLPQIREFFSINGDQAQWTVTLFFLAYAFSQLIYSPFANRYNRKTTIRIGLTLACIGASINILSAYLGSFPTLLFGLLLTALGSGVGLSIVFTMINDVYDLEESRKIVPLVTLSFSTMPGVSVFIGGFLVDKFSWPACFIFLLFYILVIIGLTFLLPETSKGSDPHALKISNITARYRTIFATPTVWLYALIWGLCTSIVCVYAANAPAIVITMMGKAPSEYGMLNLIPTSGYLFGTILTRAFASKISTQKTMVYGQYLIVMATGLLLAFTKFHLLNPLTFFTSMFLINLAIPPIFSNCSSLAVRDCEDKATASAVVTFINMGTAVTLLFITGLFPGNPESIFSETCFWLVLILTFFVNTARKR